MGKVKSELHSGKQTETETVQSMRIMVGRKLDDMEEGSIGCQI